MANLRRQAAALRRRRRVPAQLYGTSTPGGSGDWVNAWGNRPVRRATPLVDADALAAAGRRLAARRRTSALFIAPPATPEFVASLTTDRGYLGVPLESTDDRQHRRQVAVAVNRTLSGRLNNTGDMTLAANSAATILKDQRLAPTSWIQFDPMTANAAAELAAGTMYVTAANRQTGAFTITHANAGTTDRTFRYAILG